jgi:hypothetical protein
MRWRNKAHPLYVVVFDLDIDTVPALSNVMRERLAFDENCWFGLRLTHKEACTRLRRIVSLVCGPSESRESWIESKAQIAHAIKLPDKCDLFLCGRFKVVGRKFK